MKIPRWLRWILPGPPLTKLLTPRAQQAFALARRIASENHTTDSVDTDDLLAGLLQLDPGSIGLMLQAARIDVAELRTTLHQPGATPATPDEAMRMPFLPSIKRTLSAAMREARKMGDAYVGLDHLLLGLLANGEGPGASALISRGMTLERTRAMLRLIRDAQAAGQPSPILVMFDVDGTLVESFDLDSATYVDAMREIFGFHDVSDDWAAYQHVTDTGILTEIFEARRGRPPTPEETSAAREHFASLLKARIEAAGGMRPVPGAAALLSRLLASPDRYAVAYASGGWETTALRKLRSAGLPVDEVPGAFADDDVSREGICRTARRRIEERRGREFPTVVYVGDGVWDVRTSRQLGYGFVGIGREASAARLRDEGAANVLDDFQNGEAFLTAVKHAALATLLASSRYAETAESAR